jgi:hypothetical protein
MECLDQDIDPHSLKQDRLSGEIRPSCSLCSSQQERPPLYFLVDIKLALGNNPPLFPIFFWNLHVAYVIRLQYFGTQR